MLRAGPRHGTRHFISQFLQMFPDPFCTWIVRSAAFLQDRECAVEERLRFVQPVRVQQCDAEVVEADPDVFSWIAKARAQPAPRRRGA